MRVLVGSSWPFATAPPHIGHAAGFALPADVYARYRRWIGGDVRLVMGTDDWGSAPVIAARESGTTPAEVVATYRERIRSDFASLGITPDVLGSTSSLSYVGYVRAVLLRLFESRVVTRKVHAYPYDHYGKAIPDRAIVGRCPVCGSQRERADHCSNCGRPLEPQDLSAVSAEFGYNLAEWRSVSLVSFDPGDFRADVELWLESAQMSPVTRAFARQYIGTSTALAITRPIEWGIAPRQARSAWFPRG